MSNSLVPIEASAVPIEEVKMPLLFDGLLKTLMPLSRLLKGSIISAVATEESIVPSCLTSLSKYLVSLDCD